MQANSLPPEAGPRLKARALGDAPIDCVIPKTWVINENGSYS